MPANKLKITEPAPTKRFPPPATPKILGNIVLWIFRLMKSNVNYVFGKSVVDASKEYVESATNVLE